MAGHIAVGNLQLGENAGRAIHQRNTPLESAFVDVSVNLHCIVQQLSRQISAPEMEVDWLHGVGNEIVGLSSASMGGGGAGSQKAIE